jgi:DNA-binding transcriptional MerR regulator
MDTFGTRMPYKEKTVERLYWSIGEVAEEMGVNTSLIRHWEKEFGMIRPKRTGRGDRQYTRKDIDLLKRIQELVKEQGYTLQGARELLRRSEPVTQPFDPHQELRKRLHHVRDELIALAATSVTGSAVE